MKKYLNLFIISVLVFSSFGSSSIAQALSIRTIEDSDSPGQNLGQEVKGIERRI